MKKLLGLTALALSLNTQAEVIELTFNSAILTYATKSTDEAGRFAKRLNETVTFSTFNDSRERGRRSVSTEVHQSRVQGDLSLGINRQTLGKAVALDVAWSPKPNKNCYFRKTIAVTQLPMKYESQRDGCNFYMAIKEVSPLNNNGSGNTGGSFQQRGDQVNY